MKYFGKGLVGGRLLAVSVAVANTPTVTFGPIGWASCIP
jgi:hypothetical protein